MHLATQSLNRPKHLFSEDSQHSAFPPFELICITPGFFEEIRTSDVTMMSLGWNLLPSTAGAGWRQAWRASPPSFTLYLTVSVTSKADRIYYRDTSGAGWAYMLVTMSGKTCVTKSKRNFLIFLFFFFFLNYLMAFIPQVFGVSRLQLF